MNENTTVTLSRDVDATVVPAGHTVTLQKDQRAHITQSLGGTYTIIVNGNMFRIAQKNAGVLGITTSTRPCEVRAPPAPRRPWKRKSGIYSARVTTRKFP